jgi:hypothetical protein
MNHRSGSACHWVLIGLLDAAAKGEVSAAWKAEAEVQSHAYVQTVGNVPARMANNGLSQFSKVTGKGMRPMCAGGIPNDYPMFGRDWNQQGVGGNGNGNGNGGGGKHAHSSNEDVVRGGGGGGGGGSQRASAALQAAAAADEQHDIDSGEAAKKRTATTGGGGEKEKDLPWFEQHAHLGDVLGPAAPAAKPQFQHDDGHDERVHGAVNENIDDDDDAGNGKGGGGGGNKGGVSLFSKLALITLAMVLVLAIAYRVATRQSVREIRRHIRRKARRQVPATAALTPSGVPRARRQGSGGGDYSADEVATPVDDASPYPV